MNNLVKRGVDIRAEFHRSGWKPTLGVKDMLLIPAEGDERPIGTVVSPHPEWPDNHGRLTESDNRRGGNDPSAKQHNRWNDQYRNLSHRPFTIVIMSESGESIRWFECPACGSIAFGEGEFICCDAPMGPIEDEERPIGRPSPGKLMRTVFDMSETEMDICLCLMEAGEVTAKELAEQTDYARSLVARHLNHLAELGIAEKNRQVLKQGGHVYTYSHADPETVRYGFTRLFLWWARHAYFTIEAFQREKLETIVESDLEEPQWRIYQDD